MMRHQISGLLWSSVSTCSGTYYDIVVAVDHAVKNEIQLTLQLSVAIAL